MKGSFLLHGKLVELEVQVFEDMESQLDEAIAKVDNESARKLLLKVASELTSQDAKDALRQALGMMVAASKSPSATKRDEVVQGFDTICRIPEVSCISPRGNFSLDFGATALLLQGKSGNFLIKREQLCSAQVLESDESSMTWTVLIRLTQNSGVPADLVILTLKGKNTGKVKAILVQNENSKLKEPLISMIQGDSWTRMKVFEGLMASCGRTVAPGDKHKNVVKCNAKNVNEGRLFLLDDAVLFVGKPLTLLERSRVEFARLDKSNSRTFEFHVKMKSSKTEYHEFTMISANDLPTLDSFLNRTRFHKGSDEAPMTSTTTTTDAASIEDAASSSEGDDDMSSDDSPYASSSSSEDDSSEGDEDADDKPRDDSKEKDEQDGDELEEDDDDESDNNDSSSSADTDDPNAAEEFEEETFQYDPADLVQSGSKRRRIMS